MTPTRNDIPIGRENAISRARLAQMWGCSDRTARDLVAHFRASPSNDTHAILSTSHKPSGYWRSNDKQELRQFIRETNARGRNTFIALRDARAVLNRIEGQARMELSV